MVFKILCVLVLWTKVASTLDGFIDQNFSSFGETLLNLLKKSSHNDLNISFKSLIFIFTAFKSNKVETLSLGIGTST